jgi:hypothetical protein
MISETMKANLDTIATRVCGLHFGSDEDAMLRRVHTLCVQENYIDAYWILHGFELGWRQGQFDRRQMLDARTELEMALTTAISSQ